MMSHIEVVNTSEKSFIDLLLSDYDELLKKNDEPLSDNFEYMKLTELRILIKNVRELTDIQLYQAYSKAEVFTYTETNSGTGGVTDVKKTVTDRKHLAERIRYLDAILANLVAYVSSRLEISRQNNGTLPRIVQLCEKYRLTSCEMEIFHLMNVIQGSNDAHVLNTLIEEDYLRKVTGFQRISGMSEIDIDVFCDGERQHMKEGLVLVDEDNGTQFNLRMQRVAVQLLYGRKVKADDLLKISATSLEDILSREAASGESTVAAETTASEDVQPSGTKRKRVEKNSTGIVDNPTVKRIVEMIANHEPSEEIATLVATLPAGERDELYETISKMEGDGPLSDEDDMSVSGSEEGESSGSDSAEDVDMQHGIPLVRSSSNSSSIRQGAGQRRLAPSRSPRVQQKKLGNKCRSPEADELDRKVRKTAAGSSIGASAAGIAFNAHECPDAVAAALFQMSSSAGHHQAMHKASSVASLLEHVVVDESESTLRPYGADSQLEYLEDSFQLIALMIKGNVARLKDDMKKEGTSRYNNTWGDSAGEMKHSKRELAAKLKLHESRVQLRLKKTVECGLALPRLEVITSRFQLDPFEKKIVVLLIGKTVSPIVKTLMETLDTSNRGGTEDVLTVGQALSILCQDFNSQISHRKYFYQSSKLLKNAVISLSKSRWHVGTGDLTENRIVLDRRILDWVVGLDSEINELVEGSDLYEPAVKLTQVVLPTGYADAILSQCRSYDEFQRYRLTAGLEKTLSYGNSLVILLCGKSGTGKTMTVNAIANELQKKVLMVDFNSLVNKKDSGSDLEVDLKGLFRESKMSNAVLFFDECEVVFKSRNLGSDRLLNSLLTEIERHDGIVFMATNRPYEIDEAMHRRITMVLEYKEPDYDMRKQIWDNLLGVPETAVEDTTAPATKGLNLADDVDTSVLAIKYELTGGFIKNAVLSSLLSALSRDKNHPVLSQQDLVDGCQLQMRGNLTQRNFEDRVAVKTPLAHLHLSKPHREAVNKIIRHEQARAKVYGSWNAAVKIPVHDADHTPAASGAALVKESIPSRCEQRASIHLFAGTRGSGKNTLVKTIAQELGAKKSKYIHVADFVSGNISDITLIFKTLVQDARLMDAMIVVDGFEHILDDSSSGEGGGGSSTKMHLILSRIMDILYQYHGCVFLLCHIENPQNIMLQRDFASRLLTFVRFTIPPHEIRSQLWRSLMPTNAPVSADINLEVLGRRFEMNAGSIRSAIANATAEVAMRTKDCVVHQSDLLAAGDYEISKLKGGNFDLMGKLFV